MESHVKWGLGFIAVGILLEIALPFLFLLDTLLVVLGIALILFGGREKKIEEVKE
ncbi:hypothetical protein [Archaeoglobus sp.]